MPDSPARVLVVYGSEGGNARRLLVEQRLDLRLVRPSELGELAAQCCAAARRAA